MTRTRINAEREHRIEMEVVVDAYNEEERAMGWYCYLEENLAFPFEERIRKAMASSPLRAGQTVAVIGLVRIPRKSSSHSTVKRTPIPLQSEQRFHAIANKQDAATWEFCLFTRSATLRSTDFVSCASIRLQA